MKEQDWYGWDEGEPEQIMAPPRQGVKLTAYIERKLKKYGYRWQWQPEIQ